MPKSIREAMYRGNNLAMVVFLGVLAIGVFSELFVENELLDKADDAVIILLAIIGVVWYFRGAHRYQFSWTPFVLVTLVFVVKALALANEFTDPAAVGDEYGIVPLALAMLITSSVLMHRARRWSSVIGPGNVVGAPIPQTGAPGEEHR